MPTRLYWHLAVAALIAFGGLCVALLMARSERYSDVMLVIFFAGAVGAVVNNYFRLARLAANAEEYAKQDNNPKLIALQMYVSLLISGMLAFVMFGLCVSGLLEGALFPKFIHSADPYDNFSRLITQVKPEKNSDALKAIVWAFVAGFSERFIPNIIDRLSARAEEDKDQPMQARGGAGRNVQGI